MLKYIKCVFKCAALLITENILKIFWIFVPIKKNKILYISFNGKQYSDSPMYIERYISDENLDINLSQYFVCPKTKELSYPNDIKIVNNDSISIFFNIINSKLIVTNDSIKPYIPIRNEQIVLNTWHGGGNYKKIGLDVPSISKYDKLFYWMQGKKYSAFISSSKFYSLKIIRGAFGYKGNILEYGLPRNSILFRSYLHTDIKNNVINTFNIKDDRFIVLYAPTYRGSNKKSYFIDEKLDLLNLSKAIEKKYKKKVQIVFRAHHNITFTGKEGEYINASHYQDMQELLIAADMLVTDYSSCMWDMSLMKKPVLLYVPDIDIYKRSPGFYCDLKKLPFVYGRTNDELIKKFEEFDNKNYSKMLEQYHKDLGSYEGISSLEAVCEWICDVMKGK